MKSPLTKKKSKYRNTDHVLLFYILRIILHWVRPMINIDEGLDPMMDRRAKLLYYFLLA